MWFDIAIVAMALGAAVMPAQGEDRLSTLVEIQGVRAHSLEGIGLVVGLAGTGDKQSMAVEAQQELLNRFDIDVGSVGALASKNTAVVSVKAKLPAFAKEGTRFDVAQVSSIGDAKSLEGGTLMMTYLKAINGDTYAIAEGSLSVGGFGADSAGGSVRQNHLLVGRIPMGAHVEREVPSTFTDGDRVVLLLKRPDFETASVIQDALDLNFGTGTASALGGGTVAVKIPPSSRVSVEGFIAEVMALKVKVDAPARVVINERTGTIVLGGDVRVKNCQIAHGSLTITVQREEVVSQPGPFSDGDTAITTRGGVEAETPIAYMSEFKDTVSAKHVADALNALKVTPLDMIAIFQALREAGALEADVVNM
jgi:flagellar P-ring protein precursor FlgI